MNPAMAAGLVGLGLSVAAFGFAIAWAAATEEDAPGWRSTAAVGAAAGVVLALRVALQLAE